MSLLNDEVKNIVTSSNEKHHTVPPRFGEIWRISANLKGKL